MQRELYPDNWKEIALKVKSAANWQCQWCDRPCRLPKESDLDLILRLENDPIWGYDFHDCETGLKLGRFTLTVAHLDHDPGNPNARLVPLCSVCHCRYDLRQMGRKRQLKAERMGQLKLNLEDSA